MKFLLVAVSAKFIHSNPAVYSILSYIRNHDRSFCLSRNRIEIAEYTINHSAAEILADIFGRKPDVVAFSCYIWNREVLGRLLAELPKVLPLVPVWLGGPEVSYDTEDILRRFPAVKGIVSGEGEQACKELFEFYCEVFENENNRPETIVNLSQIDGIVYRDNDGAIIRTAGRELLDINDLSFPYSDLSGDDIKNRIIYYESSRGCPFQCSYCLSSVDKSIRFKDIKTVKNELAVILAHEVAQVKFIDRTFNSNHEHAMAIWQFIRDHDNGITNFHFEIAADLLTLAEIELLRSFRPGLVQLEIGVQSTNQKTLESINRRMDFMKVKDAVSALGRNRNIHLHLDLIAGLPFEDYDTFVTSFNNVYALKPDNLQLGFLKALPGTPIRQQAEELGIVYEEAPPYQVLYTKWLGYSEMQRLHRIEDMVSVFYNTNQFINTISVLELAFLSPFHMYEKLAAFFVEKDYFRKRPARAFRYQALLDFAVTYDPSNKECYQELLTHDMFLREKSKSRPAFCRDLSLFREQIKAFYAEEEKDRRFLPEYLNAPAGQLIRMTAVEVFNYNVEAPEAIDKLCFSDKPYFILYDYQERDPLSKNARVIKCCF